MESPDSCTYGLNNQNFFPLDIIVEGAPENTTTVRKFIVKCLDDERIELTPCDDAPLSPNLIPNSVQLVMDSDISKSIEVPVIRSVQQESVIQHSSSISSVPEEKPSEEEGIGSPPSYSCFKCPENFEELQLFRQHLKTAHKPEKKFPCPKCPAGFNIEVNLKIHSILNHFSGNLYFCFICGSKCRRKASFRSHVMIHQVEELVVCDHCSAEFQNEDELLKHVEIHCTRPEQKPSTDSWSCPYCKMDFPNLADYKRHLAKHAAVKRNVLKGKKTRRKRPEGKRGLECRFCGKTCPKLSVLERHERVHTGEKPYKCQICGKVFAQKGSLRIHLYKHNGLKPYHCTLCPSRFSQKGNLRVHVEKTHTAPADGQKIYRCSQCTCIFRNIASLNGHITKIHLTQSEEPTDAQDIIDKVMGSLKELQSELGKSALKKDEVDRADVEKPEADTNIVKLAEHHASGGIRRYTVHQKKIGDVRWYFCSHCSSRFKKPSDLIRHFRTHTREKPYKCSRCDQAFSVKSTLVSHQKIHEKPECECDRCDSSFRNSRNYKAHIRRHDKADAPNYTCAICKKLLPSEDEAKDHRESHKNDIPEGQDIIEPLLKQPLYQTAYGPLPLKPPKATKLGDDSPSERPHKCKSCSARFSSLKYLRRHSLQHEGERTCVCSLCDKRFLTKSELNKHQLCHKAKKFACETCGKRFATPYNLKRHMLGHSKARPYMCPYCDKSFKTVLLCRSHIKNLHHPGEAEAPKEEPSEPVSEPPVEPKEPEPVLLQPSEQYQMVYLNLNELPLANSDSSYLINPLEDLHDSTVLLKLGIDGKADLNLNEAPLVSVDANQSEFPTVDLGELPISFFNASEDSNLVGPGGEIIPNDASVICINCHKMFSDCYEFEKHACSEDVAASSLLIQDGALGGDLKIYDVGPPDSGATSEILSEEPPVPTVPNVEAMKRYTYKKPLQEDIKKLEQPKSFACKHCNFTTDLEDKYRKHLFFHPDLSDKICKFCCKDFKKPSDLKRHLRTHTGERPFECELCHKKFSLKSTMESHLRTHDMTGASKITCDVCNSNFTSKSSLKVHMLLHTGARPHACSYCDQTFRTSAIRKSHEKSLHLNQDGQKSKLSGRNLVKSVVQEVEQNVQSEALASEMFLLQPLENSGLLVAPDVTFLGVFNEEEPKAKQKGPRVKCDICQKLYASKDVLRKHKKLLHGQNKKFPCIKCDKGYDQLEDLQKHIIKLHTGLRPYACQYCSNSFSEENSLNTHIKRIHQKSETTSALLGLQYDLSIGDGLL